MRGLALIAAAGVIVAAAVMFTRDPEEAWAIAAVIAALSIAAGALVISLQLRAPRPGRRGRGAVREGVAIRRGVEVTIGVALLLWLRVVDGLSLVTAGFVIGAFLVAEAVLSASARPSR